MPNYQRALSICFWLSLAIVVYTYAGYGLLMGLVVWLQGRRAVRGAELRPAGPEGSDSEGAAGYTPPVTLLIPAYNEEGVVDRKVENSLQLDYPTGLLTILFVADGSSDGTVAALQRHPDVTVLHAPLRLGKPAAINRAMRHVQTPIVVFSDANTLLNRAALRLLVRHFAQPEVGCVAGEKRVATAAHDQAAGAGESLYWRYESTVKRWESRAGNVMGAAGELFAIRSALYTPLPDDALLDDYVLSFRIALAGYRLVYEPDAYALEHASASIGDEWKRKTRIAAGGLQSILWLTPLLNPFRFGFLSVQYISHRVLRWTLTPLLLLLLLPLNGWLAWARRGIYRPLWWGQLLFYAAAWTGWRLETRRVRFKPLFVPFYFVLMNLAVFAGLARYLRRRQDIRWEKARRAG
jgi:cellulose synthase/poly-beta-1,6-N-acetylglucosamine synthase-like glycosyltransferase